MLRTKMFAVSMMVALSSLFGVFALSTQPVSAASSSSCSTSSWFLGLPTWYKYLEVSKDSGTSRCSISGPEDSKGNFDIAKAIPLILFAIFEIILRIAGLAAVGFIIYGGIQYVLSQGEPDRTKASKNTIINAFIGLAITMSATAIVNLIGNTLA